MDPLDDTIAAVVSPPGGAARGILRISGPGVPGCLRQCFCADAPLQAAARRAPRVVVGVFRLPQPALPLPCDLYLWPQGRSYTGQQVAEIHTLGSPPLLQAALDTLCAAGARPAAAGEFTLRAFLAGRIDLTQAEAVLGVVDAVDQGELDVALSQLAGGLARPLHALGEMLVELLAHLEAALDFAEEDLSFITPQQLQRRLSDAAATVSGLVRQMASRSHSAGAARVVLVGRPNTGKSSLFNALSGDPLALVSHQPGTTRDYLTAQLDLGGVPCELIDTAGWGAESSDAGAAAADQLGDCPNFRATTPSAVPEMGLSPSEASDAVTDDFPSVRQAAQAASREQERRAQVRILCLDSTRPLDDWEQSQLGQTPGGPQVLVLTKVDVRRPIGFPSRAMATSSVTGEGIDALRAALRHAVLSTHAAGAEVVAATAVRCRHCLRRAAGCLNRARHIAKTGQGEELVAAEIRVALDELGKVVGTVYTEDVLERVFSRFCIGK